MASRTSKKGAAAAAAEEPVMIPVFVPHHYLKVETRDGHMFVVDRNVVLMSRLIRNSLRELYRIALTEDDDEEARNNNNQQSSSINNQQEAPRGSVRPSVLQESLLGGLGKASIIGGDADDVEGGGIYEDASINTNNRNNVSGSEEDSGMMGAGSNKVLHILADGDIEVLINSERTAVAAGQLPIVYCLPSTSTADNSHSAMGMMTSFTPAAPPSGKGGSKQMQQAQMAHEQAMLQQQQRAKVDEALESMRDTPLTHIRLTKLTSDQFEIAMRFMQYKYKVDHIADGSLRPGFRGFIPGQPSYPPPPSVGSAPAQPTAGSPTSANKRKSLAASSMLGQSVGGGGGEGCTGDGAQEVDPITGSGSIRTPDPFAEHHILLLAISSLLQL